MAGCSNKDWIDVIVKSGYSTFASYTLILGLTMVLARSFVSMQSAIVRGSSGTRHRDVEQPGYTTQNYSYG